MKMRMRERIIIRIEKKSNEIVIYENVLIAIHDNCNLNLRTHQIAKAIKRGIMYGGYYWFYCSCYYQKIIANFNISDDVSLPEISFKTGFKKIVFINNRLLVCKFFTCEDSVIESY